MVVGHFVVQIQCLIHIYCSRTFLICLFLRISGASYGRFIAVRFGFNLLTYRVRINYRRILQNHIFTNTEQKYMMLLPFERGMHIPPLPKTLPELLERIKTAIGNVTQDMLERVWQE